MKQALPFRIEGEFMTNLARERFYKDHDLSSAIRILKSCTETDALSEEEHILLCLKIINGNAKIVGTYPDDDYDVVECDSEENPFSILDEITKMQQEIETLKAESAARLERFVGLLDILNLPEYKLREVNKEYQEINGEPLFPDLKTPSVTVSNLDASTNSMLDSYISHMKSDSEDDYGWLEPDGTYHPMGWGKHSDWAKEYCDEHYPYKDNAELYWIGEGENRKHVVNGDFLIYRLHWVLIDSPYQGPGLPQYNMAFGLTKAQKEFLYDYFMKRNRHTEANALYQGDD